MFNFNNFIVILFILVTIIFFYVLSYRIRWREIMAFLLTPLARKIPSFIMPNHISLMNFFFALAAGLFFYLAKYNYFFFLAAAASILVYTFNDNLDGVLARTRQQVSKSGTFLDSTLDLIAFLLLLTAIMLGGHIRSELIIISMLCTLFYGLINMEAQTLTSSASPLAQRGRWIILAIILSLIAFSMKHFEFEALILFERKIKVLDALFLIVPVYQIAVILTRFNSIWGTLNKLDQEEKAF